MFTAMQCTKSTVGEMETMMNGETPKNIVLWFYSAATITFMFSGFYCAVYGYAYIVWSAAAFLNISLWSKKLKRIFFVMQILVRPVRSVVISGFQVKTCKHHNKKNILQRRDEQIASL